MQDKSYLPYGFSTSSLSVMNPPRSVIIDMIMVQFISIIITMIAIML